MRRHKPVLNRFGNRRGAAQQRPVLYNPGAEQILEVDQSGRRVLRREHPTDSSRGRGHLRKEIVVVRGGLTKPASGVSPWPKIQADRSEIEDRPNLLVLHVERLCSTLPGTIGDVISTKDQSGTTHGIHADDAHSVRYRQFENVAFFAEHSTESSKRVGIGQVTRRPYFAAGAVLAE